MFTNPNNFDRYRPLPPGSVKDHVDPPPVVVSSPGSFAWGVLHDRHPTMIQQISDAHPYEAGQRDALDQLATEVSGTKIWPIEPTETPDSDLGDWYEAPFLWAESLFYRKLLNAVSFFTPGPWHWHDPFAFLKNAELASQSLAEDLDQFNATAAIPDATPHYLHRSLWGNQADLGFAMNSTNADPATSGIIVDHSETIATEFHNRTWSTVAIIADNAGRELIADLLLIDHLIHHGHVDSIDLHLKAHPYYVSDATTTDLVACINRLHKAKGPAAQTAVRLSTALANGQLRLNAHPFYCGPHSYHHLPDDLTNRLAASSLVILKGDLNYRRLIGDHYWPTATPFANVVTYFSRPVIALRTLKSDVLVGIDTATTQHLDDTKASWRTDGTHGTIDINTGDDER